MPDGVRSPVSKQTNKQTALHHHEGNFSDVPAAAAAAAAPAAAGHRRSLSKWVTLCEKTNGDPD